MSHIQPSSNDTTSELDLGRKAEAGIVHKATWRGRVWDTLDLPKDERRLLFKVDAVLLTLMSLGYFLKNLDQQNINSAYLSGMREDLGMWSNELVTAVSIWTVGYVIGQVPVNLLLTRVPPRYVISGLEIGWGIATLGSYAVHSFHSLYALRFLVGLFESGFYSAAHMILGSWYTPRELGKRSVIFWLSGTIGQMFSGFLQAAAYNNLNGVHGLEGWRWLFIIDAIITLPIAVLGFFFLPDLPLQGKAPWWLKTKEFELACARVNNRGSAGREPWSWAKIRKLTGTWHIWILPITYVIWNNSIPQTTIMSFWLKSFNSTPAPVSGVTYSIADINQLPLVGSGVLIVAALVFAWISDGPLSGRRWPIIYLCAAINVVFAVLMRQLPLYEHIKGRYAIYWLQQAGNSSGPLILAWINEICKADLEKRALLVALGNDLAYVVQAVAPNFVWKTTDFPAAKSGLLWSIVLSVLLIIWTALVQFLLRHDRIKETRDSKETPRTERYDSKDLSSDGSQTPEAYANDIKTLA